MSSEPSIPPTRLNPTRPSLVMTRIWACERLPLPSCHNAGSIELPFPLVVEISLRVPPRWLLGAPRVVTQRASPATATPAGALPTSILVTTALVSGSRRATVPWTSLAAHTPPGLTATALGPSPTRTVATTVSLAGSTLDTVPSRLLATHTSRPPR
jgi:hypothetical protein